MPDIRRLTWEETRQKLLDFGVPEVRLPLQWRPGIDLRFLNLKGINLQGAYLKQVKLAGTDLSNANLSYSDLSGADFVN